MDRWDPRDKARWLRAMAMVFGGWVVAGIISAGYAVGTTYYYGSSASSSVGGAIVRDESVNPGFVGTYLDFIGAGITCASADGGADGSVTQCTVPSGVTTIQVQDTTQTQLGTLRIRSEVESLGYDNDAGTNVTTVTFGRKCEIRTTTGDAGMPLPGGDAGNGDPTGCLVHVPPNSAVTAELTCHGKQISAVDGGQIDAGDGGYVPITTSRVCVYITVQNANGTFTQVGAAQTCPPSNLTNTTGVNLSAGVDGGLQWWLQGGINTTIDWDCVVTRILKTEG